MNLPRINAQPTVDDAKQFVAALTRFIGPGFHPDTDAEEYVTENGQACFTREVAASLNRDLDTARAVLERDSIDICAIALPIQRRLLQRAML